VASLGGGGVRLLRSFESAPGCQRPRRLTAKIVHLDDTEVAVTTSLMTSSSSSSSSLVKTAQ